MIVICDSDDASHNTMFIEMLDMSVYLCPVHIESLVITMVFVLYLVLMIYCAN